MAYLDNLIAWGDLRLRMLLCCLNVCAIAIPSCSQSTQSF